MLLIIGGLGAILYIMVKKKKMEEEK